MSSFIEYRCALHSADEALAAVIMARAIDDYELSLFEYLDLFQLFHRLFSQD